MGQSKWRKEEIARLKQNTPEEAARWRQLQNDKRAILTGINPEHPHIEVPAAMARALHALFIEAKVTGNIDPPVALLHSTIDATVRGLRDIPIGCKKGCSHCCYTWVSIAGPEALYTAKVLKQRDDASIAKVRLADEQTKQYDFHSRPPYPCPLLNEDICSIYENRPKACRLASSANAEICASAYHSIEDSDVPTPVMYMTARGMYATAIAASLRHAKLPHYAYEFNAAVVRALDTDEAEQRWLSGEDIFADIRRDPEDVFSSEQSQMFYEHVFANK